MRNLKKVLALVIAFSMMLSVVAFAGYPDVPADADYADAVSLLSALNIIKGDDLGNFNPDNTITRAEFAAVVCRALGLENSATGAAGATSFVDVAADHWASGYINLATQNGIINGYGDGNFGPEDKVTYEQAVKMLVCALGFEPMAAQKGGYPTGYLVVANAYKITAGVTASVEAPRKTVAKLVYNALSTPKMDQTSFGMNAEWEVLDGKNDREYATLLTDMDIYIASGIVGVYDVADDTITFSVQESSDDYEFGLQQDLVSKKDGYNKIYDANAYDLELNVNGSDIRNYATQYVDAYVAKDNRGDYDVLAVVPSTMGETLTILSDDIKKVDVANKTLEYYVDGTSKTKKIKLDKTSMPYSYNKYAATTISIDDLDDVAKVKEDTELKFVEQNGDTSYDMIIATKYADARVTGVEEDRIKLDTRWVEIDYDKDVEYVLLDATGAEIELADFAEDDVVAIVANAGSYNDATYLRLVKLTDSAITGTVTEMATQGGKNYVWIDGEKYQDTYGLKQEAEGTFYISMTGKIFDFEGTSGIGNYAYVLEAAQDTAGSFSNNRWELKLLTVDGGVAEYTLTEDASKDFEVAKYNSNTDSLKDLVTGSKTSSKWIWDGTGVNQSSANLKNANRLVAYRTNSKGEIKSLELIEIDDTDAAVKTIKAGGDEYNSKTQKLDGFTVEEDTVIFDITGNEAESAFASDISYLVDDSKYDGLVVTLDKEVKLVVITDGDAKLSNETGFAIVTEVKSTTVDGEDLVIVDYIQNMEAGQITFNDDSSLVKNSTNGKDYEDLDIGDVIMFNANADGIVSTYAILATISGGQPVLNTNALDEFDEDNEFVYGYIASEDGGKSTKYENVTVGFGANHNYAEISVGAETNTYSYFATNKNIEIKDQYITEDADWYIDGTTDAKDLATFFFARLVDESLIDIYTFGTPVEGKSNIEAVNTTWVTCLAGSDNATVVTSKGLSDQAAADAVVDDFDALPAAIAAAADKKAVVDARAAYTALTAAQQALVKAADLQKLTDAEALVATYDAAQAAAVDTLITALPAADAVAAGDEAAIIAAEAAYDALDDDQKALVADYAKLQAVRTAFDALS